MTNETKPVRPATTFLVSSAEGLQGYNYSTAHSGHVDYSAHLHGLDRNMTVDEYVKAKGWPGVILMDEDTFFIQMANWENTKYLTEATEISETDYDDMLGVLPPENWTRTGEFEHFRMCEYMTSDITAQYATAMIDGENKFLTKMIRIGDKSTWITPADFDRIFTN